MNERRALRVLHVGNIANNAYHNAKLLNAAGFDCDVLCYDAYHAMGCPEWEDADFEGDVGDLFFPAWHRVDVRGFERPRWFAQGPLQLAALYLIARRRGRRLQAVVLWHAMTITRVVVAEIARRGGTEGGRITWDALLPRSRPGLGRILIVGPREALATAGRLALSALSFSVATVAVLAIGGAKLLLQPLARLRRARASAGPAPAAASAAAASWTDAFRTLFPSRRDALLPDDLVGPAREARFLLPLFGEYDVVVAYATDPIFPLLAGHRPYLAFEHGTLREIPDEPTPRGRQTALAFALADHVLVTNHDCVGVAARLAPGRFTAINHPWDEDHALGISAAPELRRRLLQDLGGDLLLFFPTRHDWVPGSGYADKANDRFLRAFARAIREDGLRFALVCCEWGADVAASKALLAELGVASAVRWMPALGTVRFEQTALASDYVVDQFELGAIGGIAFKALAAGRPLLTHLDEAPIRRQYGELPPVENARTEDEIREALRRIAKGREGWEERCHAARAWIKRHHGKEALVSREREIFERVLAAPRAVGPLAALERSEEPA